MGSRTTKATFALTHEEGRVIEYPPFVRTKSIGRASTIQRN